VPEVEERLDVEKRPVETGEVQVRKTVEEERQTVPVELRREEATVERRDVGERPLARGEAERAFQDETIRVPLRGEEALARKEAVVTGEVVVDKEQTTERRQVGDTVRRTEVQVDDQGQAGSADRRATRWADVASRYRSIWQQRYGTSDRRWEDYEPGYRYAYEMQQDRRYRGRTFDEVETDLQQDWRTRQQESPWDKVRSSIREAWTDVTGAA
jgi:uncharacterized protein (TIGR02271 family)